MSTPTLYIRRGRYLRQVTPVEASRLMEVQRERTIGCHGSARDLCRDIPLHDIDGRVIGKVSFNGRVWLGEPGRDRGVEIPLPGVRTVRECEAEGWR